MPHEPPRHGDRGTEPEVGPAPRGLTVAVGREAGARGTGVAQIVGRVLGWQVYTPEMIDFLARDEAARAEVLADVSDTGRAWAEAAFREVVRARGLAPTSDTAAVTRLVFALAAKGDTILVGRGAGFLLPPATTIHVRIVAPRSLRIGYLAQRLRLTEPEAVTEVLARDARRAAFLAPLTDRDATDPTAYDLVINTGRVGLDSAADLIATTVRAKRLLGVADPSSVEEALS